ncbi:unnamed protein product, partial [Sphacelaria rigidula]
AVSGAGAVSDAAIGAAGSGGFSLPSPATLLFAGGSPALVDGGVGRVEKDITHGANASAHATTVGAEKVVTVVDGNGANRAAADLMDVSDRGECDGSPMASTVKATTTTRRRLGGMMDGVEETERKEDPRSSASAIDIEAMAADRAGAPAASAGLTLPENDTGATKPGRRERLMKTARARRAQAPGDALWTEVYRPRSPDEMCGNAQTIAALSAWLGEWKQKRGRGGAGDGDAAGTRGSDDGEDSDEWEYRFGADSGSEGDMGLCNMAMLCGPSGVGKTSAVYGCAGALGYEVIEVNPSQLRSGAAIRRLFGEAAQSHHVSSTDANPRQ